MYLKAISKRLRRELESIKFWYKTGLYYYFPNNYGYYFHLRQFRDPNLELDSSRKEILTKHNDKSGWQKEYQGGIKCRDYENYDEYKTHQAHKFDLIIKERGGFTNREIVDWRYKFYKRFRHLSKYIPKSSQILCAGARQGTEVEVLRDLGYKNAYGIDLNPGPDNKLVHVGDFMHLDESDSSLDMIYCNAIDHAFDLEAMFIEHARVIKPDGYVLYEFYMRHAKSFEAVEWKSSEVVFSLILKYFREVIKVDTEQDIIWCLFKGKRKLVDNHS